jgi:polar amino acid transport system substrate-binding protein
MTGRPRRTLARAAALAVGLALGAGACAHTDVPDDLPGPTTPTTPTTAAPTPAPAGCSDVEGQPGWAGESLAPTNGLEVVPGSLTDTIKRRGYLRVGVDTSTRLFSSVDPATGEFEGFDIDVARAVAEALFGEANDDTLRLVAIPYSQRVQVLSGEGYGGEPQVDMVVDTFTINCRRDQEIDFSSQYFSSGQKLLVPTSLPSTTTIEDLNGDSTVCAPYGSTSIANLADTALVGDDPPEVRGVDSQADCLVLLQQGKVDALSGDDTVLAGFVDQDPNVHIVGDAFTEEPYGIGLPPDQGDWVRYVNAALEDFRSSGGWMASYDRWLGDALERGDVQPPVAQYRDD